MGVDTIMVTGEHISQVYIDYTNSLLVVNRTYQRKLVWTLDEKQCLIDTILKGYPVPLFLFVKKKEKREDGSVVWKREIIDGLQRLEAIISFINNKFPVLWEGKWQYFNLDSFSGPTIWVHEGKLKQKTPVLDFTTCNKFSQYMLAVTTIEADEISVEDVFKRINASGRQLSPQELRQAGVVSKFNRMVQKIASRLRGDYTKQDSVPLEDMEKYSLSSSALHYGLDIRNVFWTKQGIIDHAGLRRSKDEEIIANLCNCILGGYQTSISKRTLDKAYDESSDTYKLNEKRLIDSKQVWVTTSLLQVVEDFDNAFGKSRKTFESLVTTREKCHNKDLVFIVLFLAVFQLKQEGYVFEDYLKFANSLQNIADADMKELIDSSNAPWNIEQRNRLVERAKNRIRKCMHFTEYKPEWDDELLNLLGKAAVEEQMYDFKLGLTDLADGKDNKRIIGDLVKTLTAMANTKPGERGYVIIGVADNEKAAGNFERHYNLSALKCNDLFITGVAAEAVKYKGSVENYVRYIQTGISNLKNKVIQEVISDILRDVKTMRYHGRVLVVLSLATNKPLFFENELYIRHQSSNHKVQSTDSEFYKILGSFDTGSTDSGKSAIITADKTNLFS